MTIDTATSSVSTPSGNRRVDELLERGIEEIIVKSSLEGKLKSEKKLRIKYGIDPNKKDIHLGHAVPIRKLKAFQDLGHQAVFIIGDYTARIGDPSAKEKTREFIDEKTVKKNTNVFFSQAFRILDREKTEIHLQSDWYKKFDLEKIFELTSKVSVAQVMEHETFRQRLQKKQPFMVHEEIYPLLQGFDSVAVRADVELGGADQKFNLLMGRQMQKAYGQAEQDIVMMKYLVGLDGKEKMSKSLGNYIAISDSPTDMYGKIMSIPDNLIMHYYELCTDVTMEALKIIEKELKEGKNPREVKAQLAKVIVEMYHSADDAERAAGEFDRVFRDRERPSEIEGRVMEDNKVNYTLIGLIVELFKDISKSEARRLIEHGGVEVEGIKIIDPQKSIELKDQMIIRVGKRKFVRIKK
ncbi:MAG TPA: tyrosine--tRNA ligase [Patescibacteria group bacterium]|nr:tyrosine--tRNA ligase [Patescibacteria group bacterium]